MSVMHRRIRKAVKAMPDGFTVKQLQPLGVKNRGGGRLINVLLDMPDAYIDRWVPYRRGYAPVWMIVERPADCPPPDGFAPLVRPDV